MEFIKFRDLLKDHFDKMAEESDILYEVQLDKDRLWNTYLDSFPEGTNEVYRERRVHDCSTCRQFIKAVGRVVSIKNGEITTIWDFETDDPTYQTVVKALSALVKSSAIADVFISDVRKVGCAETYEEGDRGYSRVWNHLYVEIPDKFFLRSREGINSIKSRYRDDVAVLHRSLSEITEESVDTVIELIDSGSLYRGDEWKSALVKFRSLQSLYQKVPEDKKSLFAWEFAPKQGASICRIRNHSIGTLLVDISEGVDLESAVKRFETMVAPANYKRPKEIFTQKMLDDAKETIMRLGYLDSLGRRYAKLDDITVNNILFSNRDSAGRIKGAEDIFGEMAKQAKSKPKKFDHVEEVSVTKFINEILPTVTELELYLDNDHTGNLVSLIAPKVADSKTMFKWNNNFSWAYSGNLADSMKERVKAAGGNVEGDLRFSIQWNDSDPDGNDLDAHCMEPNGYEIYFGNARQYSSNHGMLDVDIINPQSGVPAVENIAYADRRKMTPGTYTFFVHCYTYRGGNTGFRAQIEFDGKIYSFDYNKPLRTDESIVVAEIVVDKDHNFIIQEKIASDASSREVWNLKTNSFIPVSVVMYSPNYWDEQNGIGNKHYFFMLKDCINAESPNGFYNEFLKNELLEHKRVLAALGSKMRVEDDGDQLSGVGFSSTKRAEVVVKVKSDDEERLFKVKF